MPDFHSLTHRGGTRAPGLVALCVAAIVSVSVSVAPVEAGEPQGRGRGAMMHDDDHAADMQLFHALIDSRQAIRRTVTRLPNGIDTVTESDDPTVAAQIRAHVVAMSARVTTGRPIHQRDPLFRALFEHAASIEMRHEATPRGVRVIETSADPYVATLIQAHADVVTGFITNGRSEMMKDHDVPGR